MCEQCVFDLLWDWPTSPEACYYGEGALGSWEEYVRHIPDGAYGTHPAVDDGILHLKKEDKNVKLATAVCCDYLQKHAECR